MAGIARVSTVQFGGTRTTTSPMAEKTSTDASPPGGIFASRRSSSERPITLVTSAARNLGARLVYSDRPITENRRARSLESVWSDERMKPTPETCTPTKIAIQIPITASGDIIP